MPRTSYALRSRRAELHSQSPVSQLADSALPDTDPVKAQLERICGSRLFSGAHRSQLFLRYVVEHSIAHPTDPIKEYSIALDVFGRDSSYDPAIDATVRVEAGRLRSRLIEYYAGEGQGDPLVIEMPRGGYRAVIRPQHPAVAPVPQRLTIVRRPLSAESPRLRHLWAVPVAFIVGALLGYRASHSIPR